MSFIGCSDYEYILQAWTNIFIYNIHYIGVTGLIQFRLGKINNCYDWIVSYIKQKWLLHLLERLCLFLFSLKILIH